MIHLLPTFHLFFPLLTPLYRLIFLPIRHFVFILLFILLLLNFYHHHHHLFLMAPAPPPADGGQGLGIRALPVHSPDWYLPWWAILKSSRIPEVGASASPLVLPAVLPTASLRLPSPHSLPHRHQRRQSPSVAACQNTSVQNG